MSIDPGGQVNFDVGIYKGDLNDQGVPHGHGRLDYKNDDILSRKYYEGQWTLGKNTGQGRNYISRNSSRIWKCLWPGHWQWSGQG